MRHFSRIGVIIILVLFKLSTVRSSAVDCYTQIDPHYWTIDVPSQIHITTGADAERIRSNIIRYLWPEAGWPAHLPTAVTRLSKGDSDNRDTIYPPSDHLVGHWKFDGDFSDSSGKSQQGIPNGSVKAGTDNGLFGGAAQFNGGDYVTLPLGTVGADWTLMCWVKGAPGNVGMFLSAGYDYYKDGGKGWESVFLRYFSNGTSITGAINWPEWKEKGSTGHTGEWSVTQGKWHHVALTFQGATSTMKFYLDGDLKHLGNPTFPGWFNNTITLGGSYGVQGLIDDYIGLIDDVRLYNRILTDDEMAIFRFHGIPDWISTIGSDNLDEVDRIDIRMDYELHSYVYHLHPKRKINRLLIFHMGHSNDILTAGGRETIRYFLDKGFSILTFWMPLFGENTRTAQNVPNHGTYTFSSGTAGHDVMSSVLENSRGSFIRFFIEPVIVALNYAEGQFDYGDINMVGISGGGWTTHLCAALDTRIKLSFPVAGSLPLYLRSGPCPNGSKGDAEQCWPALYERIASWLDIYILGSYGRGRGQVHILNQYDSCCFWGINYRTFQPFVTEAVKALGEGFYYLYLDSSHKDHKISQMAIEEVMAQYLLSCGLRHEGDLNNDCVVDLEDIAIMTSDWLACGDSSSDCP